MYRDPCVVGVHYDGEGLGDEYYYFDMVDAKYNAPDDPPTCNRCVKAQMVWCADGEWSCPSCGHRWFRIHKEESDSHMYWCRNCRVIYGLPEREYDQLSQFEEKFCCEQCHGELEQL